MQVQDALTSPAPPQEVAAVPADEGVHHAACARVHCEHHRVQVVGACRGRSQR